MLMIRYLIIFTAFFICLPRDAQAYIDPGTGSLILQAVVAGVLAGLFTMKSFLRRIFGKFTGKKKDSETGKNDS